MRLTMRERKTITKVGGVGVWGQFYNSFILTISLQFYSISALIFCPFVFFLLIAFFLDLL